jgi:site-specific DNA recombinase
MARNQTSAQTEPKRALLYLRVSSQAQVETDFDPEGNSIPTQRQACQRRAEELGLTVVGEYVEPGRSARDTKKRPQFNAMMKRLRDARDADCIIVYNRSRLHRDAIDASLTKRELAELDVELISVMDYTAADPTGDLVANIIDSINEYQSRINGADVSIKMAAKAERGGTSGKAPLGYLNVREGIDGREVRTVITDPVRAPLIQAAFREYATGKHSAKSLQAWVTEAGLRTRPTKANPAGRPISRNALGDLLANRYYLGYVVHKGTEHPGRHEPLIEQALFDRVQAVLAEQAWAGNRDRKWNHYLRGLLWCGRCSRRMVLLKSKSARGRDYFYYLCKGKQQRECDLPRLPLDQVELAVAAHWATIAITEGEAAQVRTVIEQSETEFDQTVTHIKAQLKAQLKKISAAEQQCIDLLGDPSWPVEKLSARVEQLGVERVGIEARLAEADERPDVRESNRNIEALIQLLEAPRRIYEVVDEDSRKVLNQMCFTKLYFDSREDRRPLIERQEYSEAIEPLLEQINEIRTGQGLNNRNKTADSHANGGTTGGGVDDTGIEPVTPAV